MVHGTRQVPFYMEDLYGGFGRIEGILKAHKDVLEIEYLKKDNLFGVIKSKPKELLISYKDLTQFIFKRNWFTSKLIVRVGKLTLLEDLPRANPGELSLVIQRKDKTLAKEVESFVGLRMSEAKLALMDEDLDEME